MSLSAGSCGGHEGLEKMRKHSERDDRVVTVGSKVISSPFLVIALEFFSFRWWVSVRLSFGHLWRVLYMGARFSSISRAVVAHLWGFLHPLRRSFLHAWHSQLCLGWCCRLMSLTCLVSFTRFFTMLTLCVFFRQASLVEWYAFGGAPMCSHAGSCFLRCFDSLRGAKATLWVWAVFSRDKTFLGSLLALFPCFGGAQVVRKALGSGVDFIPSGLRWLIMALVRKAQVGRELESSR